LNPPNWWIQAIVTGDDAMVNGVLTGVVTQAMVTGSLEDDGLDFWITGG